MSNPGFQFPCLDAGEQVSNTCSIKSGHESATYVQRPLLNSPGAFGYRPAYSSTLPEIMTSPGQVLGVFDNGLPLLAEEMMPHDFNTYHGKWYQKSDPWMSYMHVLPSPDGGQLMPPFQEKWRSGISEAASMVHPPTPAYTLPMPPPGPVSPAPPAAGAPAALLVTAPALPNYFSAHPVLDPSVNTPSTHGLVSDHEKPTSESVFTDQFLILSSPAIPDLKRPVFDIHVPIVEESPLAVADAVIAAAAVGEKPLVATEPLAAGEQHERTEKLITPEKSATPCGAVKTPASSGSDKDWEAGNSPPDRSPQQWRKHATIRTTVSDGPNSEYPGFDEKVAEYLKLRRREMRKNVDVPQPIIYTDSDLTRCELLDAMGPRAEPEKGAKNCGLSLCKKRFNTFEDLAKHLDTCHPRRQRRYLCPAPGCVWGAVGFKCRSSFARHWRDMHIAPRFRCLYPGCEKRFKRSDNCLRHSRTSHLGPNRKEILREGDEEWEPEDRLRRNLNAKENRARKGRRGATPDDESS